MEAANEVGVDLKKGYNGSMTTREAGFYRRPDGQEDDRVLRTEPERAGVKMKIETPLRWALNFEGAYSSLRARPQGPHTCEVRGIFHRQSREKKMLESVPFSSKTEVCDA